jgi:hypothetical protein
MLPFLQSNLRVDFFCHFNFLTTTLLFAKIVININRRLTEVKNTGDI